MPQRYVLYWRMAAKVAWKAFLSRMNYRTRYRAKTRRWIWDFHSPRCHATKDGYRMTIRNINQMMNQVDEDLTYYKQHGLSA